MLDSRPCNVTNPQQLDSEIRDILFLDNVQRGDEISGTLHVYYTDDSVKSATLVPVLESRGVYFAWHKVSEL